MSAPCAWARSRAARFSSALAVAVAAVLAGAAPASAHGIGGDAAGKSVAEFVPIGIEHMLLGWDHLLFIVAVVLLAGAPGRAAKFISLFALGHSLTLIVATLAEWRVSPRGVDVVIALSIAYVGVVGVRGAPYNWRLFGAGVFGFGLVHGLGLSTRFQDLALPEDGELGRLIAFNIGIEIGQLLAIALVVVLGLLILEGARLKERARRPEVLRLGNMVVIVVGLVAAALLAGRSGDGADPYRELVANSAAGCTVREAEAPLVFEGGHPDKSFFAPGESYVPADFGHVVGDGLLVIRYRSSLPPAQWGALKVYIEDTQFAVAGPVEGQAAAVEVTTQRRVLTCAEVDADTIEAFGAMWFKELGA